MTGDLSEMFGPASLQLQASEGYKAHLDEDESALGAAAWALRSEEGDVPRKCGLREQKFSKRAKLTRCQVSYFRNSGVLTSCVPRAARIHT